MRLRRKTMRQPFSQGLLKMSVTFLRSGPEFWNMTVAFHEKRRRSRRGRHFNGDHNVNHDYREARDHNTEWVER